ncbi:MAG: ABC transporter substrate-binding protein [Brevibacterium aurantiacum]|uniref:Iron complex transport system substrate-binding protein n=1 Tax=Brevibacterium aurantiacum TaxID=273384 RepID=A0A2H1J231_BREAU|nr:ABC transporter substrate-binding protein [Brevibacterium aurantiacum]SMX81479.1 iron complex transport system substrate-binding protein [Brevibacterium aurantiacum]
MAHNRRLTTAAAFTALALMLAGCTPNSVESANAGDGSSTTRTIVDHTGKEVEIPAEITRVAVDQIPIASTYLAYFGGKAPHMVGMSKPVVTALEGTVAADIAPELLEVDTSYSTEGDLNAESLLEIDPDVVFYIAANTEHGELLKSAGIPAVGFATQGDPATVYTDWLRLLEQVFDEPGKMDEAIEYGQGLVQEAQQQNASIPQAKRKDVLIFVRFGQGTATVAGMPEFFGSHWLETANAENVAVGTTEPLAQVSGEQILEWDPDVVLVTGRGMSQLRPDEILAGDVEGMDLSTLTAIQAKDVYSTDLGMWNWFTPSPDAPVIAHWIGQAIYPQLADPAALEDLTVDYYERLYNYTLSDKEIDRIYESALSDDIEQ